jgi:hypothetical protein
VRGVIALVATAACGALPAETSRMKQMSDGPLVGYDDGAQLFVAPRGCAHSTFTARTTQTGGRHEILGSHPTCERLALGAHGCERHDVACP